MHLDALGDPIIIGKRYGYSTSSNGRARTVIGLAQKLTSQKVTLKVEKVNNFLYGEPIEALWAEAEMVSIRAHLIFPITKEFT